MVWSDPEILKLSREFVTVAEEVHFIYPEGAGNLERIQGDPAHEFFKRFGQAMPKEDWNDPGTKQGIYMIGPDAEYLEGGGAISGGLDEVRRRLRIALDRWKKLRREKKYENQPVPRVTNITVPDMREKSLVLRVFLRDLPRGKRDRSGRRFTKADLRGIWPDFTKWAWNINWIAIGDPKALVPDSKEETPVTSSLFRRLCRETLVDNVRGQNPAWRPEDVRLAELTMRRIKEKGDRVIVEYRGRAAMDSKRQKYAPELYGRAVWNLEDEAFESFDLLAIGDREGAGNFNQRSSDPGPAPMGIVLSLHRPAKSAAPREPRRRSELGERCIRIR